MTKIRAVETPKGVKKADIQKWVKLYTIGGWSITQIAKACNRCQPTVRKYLILEGVKMKQHNVVPNKMVRRWMRLYNVNKWSTCCIAKKYKVSVSIVMYQLKKVDIKLRSREEAQALRKKKQEKK